MAVFYRVYIGSWETGTKTYLAFIDPTDKWTFKNYIGSGKWFSSISDAVKENTLFDHTVTYLCKDKETANKLKSIGFLNAIYVPNNTKYYLSANKYIEIKGTGGTFYEDNKAKIGFGVSTSFADSGSIPSPYITNSSGTDRAGYFALKLRNDSNDFSYSIDYQAGADSFVTEYFSDVKPFIPSNDPYSKGGESETGGGTGNFDGTSEDIGIPGLPSLSAVDTGFITLFNPSAGELKNLASYLWGDMFDISTWKKIFADPMDAILGLSIVPVNVPSAGSANVAIGNISTGISMTKASSQYVSVDCGTINVNEYWGAYLDYSPYTKAEIYLPFIGTHPVTIDDIMGKPVHVLYHIDVLSGACCAYVQCGGTVLYSFVGQCSCSIPITANDWTNVINGALSIAGSIGTMVATGGASAPMAITNIASTAVNSLKPDVEKSGSMGGMGGMLGVQKPYIILTRPRQALPERQNTFTGYPSFITKTLSDCSGYTEVESIHLENVPATQNEIDEITELLKSGVII